MSIFDQVERLEAIKHNIWKSVFKGRRNRKALADITFINNQLSFMYKTMPSDIHKLLQKV